MDSALQVDYIVTVVLENYQVPDYTAAAETVKHILDKLLHLG